LIIGLPVGVGVGVGAGVGVVPPETMTCAVAVVLIPEALAAVNVYTVVAAGITTLLPAKATLPIPWSMLIVVAPVTLQLSVEDAPAEILAGLAPNELMTGCVPVEILIPDKSQLAESITISRTKGISFFMFYLPKIFQYRRKV
jgi:hypothetical protein